MSERPDIKWTWLNDDEVTALIYAAHHYDIPPIPENDAFLQKTRAYQSKLLDLRLRALGRALMEPFERLLRWLMRGKTA